MFKQFSTPAKAATLSICIAQLIACGGTGQDEGTASTYQQEFRGLVIDGYLARSTVFIDSNNNGTRDAWEAWAFTDNQGYYSYNPVTETDYCADTATPQQQQYCLISNIEYSNAVVRIDSGYDVTTGEPFLGQLSRRVDSTVAEEVNDSVISPISSLLNNVESSDRSTLLSALDAGEDHLNMNYLNMGGSGEINTNLLNTNLKIHKVVSVLSDRLTDTYAEIGENVGTPNDASSSIYRHLAQQILTSGNSFEQTLSDSAQLTNVIGAAEQSMREVYRQKDLTLPTEMTSDSSTRVIGVAQGLGNVVDTLIPDNANITMTQVKGIARSLEAIVVKSNNETGTDASIDRAINFFTDQNNKSLVDALVDTVGQDNADFNALSTHAFNSENIDTADKISSAFSLSDDAQPFTAIGGMQLRVSDLDLGTAPDDLSDTEIELYFSGENTDIEGGFAACVKYINGANADGSLGEGNTRGELVEGFWSLLGATDTKLESYSLLITLTLLETTYQAIIKPAGGETIDGVEYKRLRFDNDDEIGHWHSRIGLTEIESIPSSNEACQERLPSRVGL